MVWNKKQRTYVQVNIIINLLKIKTTNFNKLTVQAKIKSTFRNSKIALLQINNILRTFLSNSLIHYFNLYILVLVNWSTCRPTVCFSLFAFWLHRVSAFQKSNDFHKWNAKIIPTLSSFFAGILIDTLTVFSRWRCRNLGEKLQHVYTNLQLQLSKQKISETQTPSLTAVLDFPELFQNYANPEFFSMNCNRTCIKSSTGTD